MGYHKLCLHRIAEIKIDRLFHRNFLLVENIKYKITTVFQIIIYVGKDPVNIRKLHNMIQGITCTGHKIELLIRPVSDHICHVIMNLRITLSCDRDHPF